MFNKLVVIVTAVDEPELAQESTKWIRQNVRNPNTQIVLFDNGSYEPLDKFDADLVHRQEENVGGNAVFHRSLPLLRSLDADIVAYFHCDLMVRHEGFDNDILDAFNSTENLGLVGFVGSNQIDAAGGRGYGTMLNFMGYDYPPWGKASPAEAHGRRQAGLKPAVVLDHCSMIFDINVLEQIPPQEGNFAPGHFYDRICCCEVLARGFKIGYLGIECDHFSGGIGKGTPNQNALYENWLKAEGLPYNPLRLDDAVYIESERRFLSKWRETSNFIPVQVTDDWILVHR